MTQCYKHLFHGRVPLCQLLQYTVCVCMKAQLWPVDPVNYRDVVVFVFTNKDHAIEIQICKGLLYIID